MSLYPSESILFESISASTGLGSSLGVPPKDASQVLANVIGADPLSDVAVLQELR